MTTRTIVMAGVPVTNHALFHRIRFLVGDSAALIERTNGNGARDATLLVRDIEMERARKHARADRVACAADFAPAGGLSGDRDTALAQAVTECLRRAGTRTIVTDRTMPYLFAHHLREAGIDIAFDDDLGVRERRMKSAEEIDALRRAQERTHEAITMACTTIGRALADTDGVLHHEGDVLTSERLRRMITLFLLERGLSNPEDAIVATVPHVADCHHRGAGPLRTGRPVIVDIFPRDDTTRYWGDCTRTVVHGTPTDEARRMHAAVLAAKTAGTAALHPGTTGAAVHRIVVDALREHGYDECRGGEPPADDAPALRHGTGHGIGLDVHEPILLDHDAAAILEGEVFTVEPGLYCRAHGGVRVEDMVVATTAGPQTLGDLPEGLDWA